MPVLVVGGTGHVGSGIARELAARGISTAAFVRGGHAHPKSKQLEAAGVRVIEGDLLRPETFVYALTNVETVICTATSMPAGANDGLRRVDREGTLALIDSAERQGVGKFVYTSYSNNIRESSPLETAKRQCENRLLSGTMNVVILRPSYFIESWLSPMLGFDPVNGSVRIYGSGEAKVSYISSSNVVDFAVAAATRAYPHKNTTLEMGGPEALSQIEAVQIFEKVLNQRAKTEHLSMEGLEAQHQSADPLQQTFAALMLAYGKGDVVEGAVSLAQQHGIRLQSVAEHAATLGRASKGATN